MAKKNTAKSNYIIAKLGALRFGWVTVPNVLIDHYSEIGLKDMDCFFIIKVLRAIDILRTRPQGDRNITIKLLNMTISQTTIKRIRRSLRELTDENGNPLIIIKPILTTDKGRWKGDGTFFDFTNFFPWLEKKFDNRYDEVGRLKSELKPRDQYDPSEGSPGDQYDPTEYQIDPTEYQIDPTEYPCGPSLIKNYKNNKNIKKLQGLFLTILGEEKELTDTARMYLEEFLLHMDMDLDADINYEDGILYYIKQDRAGMGALIRCFDEMGVEIDIILDEG